MLCIRGLLVRGHIIGFVAVSFLCMPLSAETPETGEVRKTSRDTLQGVEPMDVEGLDPKIANILKRYYNKTFGDVENWNRIESIRFDGILHLPEGKARFVAFKRKPDYAKVVISLRGGARFIMSYDGEDAWQINTLEADAEPVAMPAKEARNFIRDASIGGHLLYPLQKGKEIRLVGVVNVEGEPCYQIEVTLPGGERIIYTINVGNFTEVGNTTVNAVNGLEEVNYFSDFRRIDGVLIPFGSIMKSEDKVVHRVEMLQVQTNFGVMPWTFKRSSGAYFPGEEIEDPAVDFLKKPESAVGSAGGFGFGGAAAGQTAFPDLDESATKSVLEDLDKLMGK